MCHNGKKSGKHSSGNSLFIRRSFSIFLMFLKKLFYTYIMNEWIHINYFASVYILMFLCTFIFDFSTFIALLPLSNITLGHLPMLSLFPLYLFGIVPNHISAVGFLPTLSQLHNHICTVIVIDQGWLCKQSSPNSVNLENFAGVWTS